MSNNKPHKGTLKRMRITKTGKVKHKSANSKHLKSVKSPNRLRRLRKDRYLAATETKALERLLFRRLRGRDQARSVIKPSPSPAARKAAQAAKTAAKAGAKGATTTTTKGAKPAARRGSRAWSKRLAARADQIIPGARPARS
jgi:large subunit ribosomal protein L35